MSRKISLTVNGAALEAVVEPRLTLVDFLRDQAGLTGTHVGCEHGVCGACSVLFDGAPIRSCLMFAVQADGHAMTTVEGLRDEDGSLGVLQDSFWETHALQCGYCTPGMLIAAEGCCRAIQIRPMRRSARRSPVISAAVPAMFRLSKRSVSPRPAGVSNR